MHDSNTVTCSFTRDTKGNWGGGDFTVRGNKSCYSCIFLHLVQTSMTICSCLFCLQNNRLPISQTHAITTSMIVPADETDSLICPESLPLPQPASTRGSLEEEEEEIGHVFTTPLQQRQLFRFSVSVYPSPPHKWLTGC